MPKPSKSPTFAMRMAAMEIQAQVEKDKYAYKIQAPELLPNVAPAGVKPPVLAMDSGFWNQANMLYTNSAGFPGYPYLAGLATRAEYRSFASAYSVELTREWITFTSAGNSEDERLAQIDAEFKRLGVREVVRKAAECDCFFGRGQIFADIEGADRATPLILSNKVIKQGKVKRFVNIEPLWTTPSAYDAIDPASPSFYKPVTWFMLGQEVHASRLMTIVTRELPDLLKPAYNFSGMSLSQLAEPYVDNWLRTRQSVADLINNFSITMLSTDMSQVLQGGDAQSLITRAKLFTATRSNRGLAMLDKDKEEITQVNTPLSGLHELQAQAQEHMCSVSRTPAVILTGISPSGLNASSEGEIRIWYDWISAQQEAYWRNPIEVMLKLVQLNLFGDIDDTIGFEFNPLYQMTPEQLANIRKIQADTDSVLVNDIGAVSAEEVRNKLARDPISGYNSLDPNDMPERDLSDLGLEDILTNGNEKAQNAQSD